MPFLSQNFHHTIESNTKVTCGFYDYTGAMVTNSVAHKEPSDLFFADLKSMLADIPGLDIEFSENETFENAELSPLFKIWGLELTPIVNLCGTAATCLLYVPFMIRHYEYSPYQYSFKIASSGKNNYSAFAVAAARINETITSYKELDYTIEIRYNHDFLLIDYRPYDDKTIKYTLCCLIKGTDVNGKDVVYISGGCNTYSTGSPFEYIYHWNTFHKLVWCDNPTGQPYTGAHSYPAYNNNVCLDRSSLSRDTPFMDLVNNTAYPHDSKIPLGSENNIVFQTPVCCWGRVTFSNNVLTGPINLTVDTDYEINGETYYCPGDNITILAAQAGVNYLRYGPKFLLKI